MILKRFSVLALVLLVLVLLAAAPVLVRERISIDSPEDSYVFNGSDIIWYSDLHDTETARVEGATGDITTDGDITADGDLTVGGTADFSGATVSGITTSTLESLTVTGAVVMTDNLTVDGTLAVTGAVTFGALDGTANDVTFYSDTAGDLMRWDQSAEALVITGTNGQNALDIIDGNVSIADDLAVDGTTNLDDVDIDLSASLNIDGHMLDVGSGTYATADGDNDLGVAGDLEVEGALVFGADGLYPLGYASSGQQIVCGSATLTGTLEITPTGLTALTYVVASQVTDPAATAALLTVTDSTATSFILSSWEADYTAGTTPIEAHYCAVGAQ